MTRPKGTDAFSVSSVDAAALARVNLKDERAYRKRVAAAGTPEPARGSSYETWLAWYEALAPGGEFNADLAEGEVMADVLYNRVNQV